MGSNIADNAFGHIMYQGHHHTPTSVMSPHEAKYFDLSTAGGSGITISVTAMRYMWSLMLSSPVSDEFGGWEENPDLGFGDSPIPCEVLFLECEWHGERQAGVGTTCLSDLRSPLLAKMLTSRIQIIALIRVRESIIQSEFPTGCGQKLPSMSRWC